MRWGWNFRPYVSMAETRRRAEKAASALGRKGQKLNPVRVDGRTIARSFWGKAWCENLESYSDYANRLPRGRAYARNGSVIDLQIAPGLIHALVSGSAVYRVTITIERVNQVAWKALKTDCAGRVGSLMDLLQSKLSSQVMEILTRRETGLFPRPTEIGLNCSCPDWAGMCKHIAATLYGVGARLDREPELFFVLRELEQAELLSAATEIKTPTGRRGQKKKEIAPDQLGAVFGIELDAVPERRKKGR